MGIARPILKESLKRSYLKWKETGEGNITDAKLLSMLAAVPARIDAEDYEYITGKPAPTPEEIQAESVRLQTEVE